MTTSIASEAVDEAELFHPRRLPVLGRAGRRLLRWLREHPAAPRFRNFSGHRLHRLDLWRLRCRRLWLLRAAAQQAEAPPPWLRRLCRQLARTVPAARASAGLAWSAIPTSCRADLAGQLARHLPQDTRWQRAICFTTSGTTGHPLRVPSLPRVAAESLVYHERALRLFGIELRAGRGEVGVVLAGYQRRCFTYVSVDPLHGECGVVKLNLHPSEWRDPDDRARYLDALAPELISGDPVSLSALAALPLRHAPRAVLSTSMALSAGLRAQLEARFGCPVLDVYSANEIGPVAVYHPAVDAFLLLQPRLYVEIVGADGAPLPLGEHGEIVVSGGFNPLLPLLRYRTGDHARLVRTPRGLGLRDLQGRAPVRFAAADGGWVNNVDLTQALRTFALRRFALHQHADRSLLLRVDAHGMDAAPGVPAEVPAPLRESLRAAVQAVLGAPLALRIEALQADDKLRQYTSDLPGYAPTLDAATAP